MSLVFLTHKFSQHVTVCAQLEERRPRNPEPPEFQETVSPPSFHILYIRIYTCMYAHIYTDIQQLVHSQKSKQDTMVVVSLA